MEANKTFLSFLDSIYGDRIKGGVGHSARPSDFPLQEVMKGVAVELEHASDVSIALEICIDHLSEQEDYYSKHSVSERLDIFGIPV